MYHCQYFHLEKLFLDVFYFYMEDLSGEQLKNLPSYLILSEIILNFYIAVVVVLIWKKGSIT